MAESSQVQDLLECPICQERFTEPKVLSCQHTFCLSCLRGYVKDARHFNCPTCRNRQNVPKAGLQAIKNNFTIKNLMEIVETPPTALCPDCCLEDQVLGECDHCKERICVSCRQTHSELVIEILLQALPMVDKIRESGSESDQLPPLAAAMEEDRLLRESVSEAIDRTDTALKQRQTEWLAQVDTVSRFRRLLAMEKVDAKICLQEEMKSYTSVERLVSLRESFAQLDSERAFLKTLAGGSCPVLNVDASSLSSLGVLCCQDVAFTAPDRPTATVSELELVEKLDKGSQTVNENCMMLPDEQPNFQKNPGSGSASSKNRRENLPLIPSNVDYQSKRFAVTRQLIDKHPEPRAFRPSCAVYCRQEKSIYCISDGEILCYDLDTLNGRCIGDVENAKHLTVMESGKVLFTDGRSVKCVEKIGMRCSVRLIVDGFKNLIHLSSLGEYFLVLDASERNLIRFNDEGKYVREYGGVIASDESSKMWVDGKGRIYVGGVSVTRKDNKDWAGRCTACRVAMSVKASWAVVISTLNWRDGNRSEKLAVPIGNKDYRYTFPVTTYSDNCCGSNKYHLRRDDESVPNDRLIREAPRLNGLCVDGDGYISVTTTGKNQVDVYIGTETAFSNELSASEPVQVVRAWPVLSSILIPLLVYLWWSLVENAKECSIFCVVVIILLGLYELYRRPVKHVASIQGFDEPSSVALTPDGKMIVCDNNGIHIV